MGTRCWDGTTSGVFGRSPVSERRVVMCLMACAVAAASGCAGPTLESRLACGDPRIRSAAVYELATVGGAEADVRLIHLLADEDEGVRFLAAAGLHRRTGRSFDFQAQGGLRARAAAIRRWAAWYVAEHPGDEDRFAALLTQLDVLDGGGADESTDRGS